MAILIRAASQFTVQQVSPSHDTDRDDDMQKIKIEKDKMTSALFRDGMRSLRSGKP
jgi:hypothetical protein